MRRSKSAARNAVAQRRWLDPETAADMGKLDPAAIAAVRAEAWPEVANARRTARCAVFLGLVTEQEGAGRGWTRHLEQLIARRRAARLHDAGATFWVCAECLPMIRAVYPQARARTADRGAGRESRRAKLDARGGHHRAHARPAAGPGSRHRA